MRLLSLFFQLLDQTLRAHRFLARIDLKSQRASDVLIWKCERPIAQHSSTAAPRHPGQSRSNTEMLILLEESSGVLSPTPSKSRRRMEIPGIDPILPTQLPGPDQSRPVQRFCPTRIRQPAPLRRATRYRVRNCRFRRLWRTPSGSLQFFLWW